MFCSFVVCQSAKYAKQTLRPSEKSQFLSKALTPQLKLLHLSASF